MAAIQNRVNQSLIISIPKVIILIIVLFPGISFGSKTVTWLPGYLTVSGGMFILEYFTSTSTMLTYANSQLYTICGPTKADALNNDVSGGIIETKNGLRYRTVTTPDATPAGVPTPLRVEAGVAHSGVLYDTIYCIRLPRANNMLDAWSNAQGLIVNVRHSAMALPELIVPSTIDLGICNSGDVVNKPVAIDARVVGQFDSSVPFQATVKYEIQSNSKNPGDSNSPIFLLQGAVPDKIKISSKQSTISDTVRWICPQHSGNYSWTAKIILDFN
ncbi:hypothetical protein SAMN05192562_10127 [Kosakonia arachidis]|uniref:Uncharacterized protein n=1 Tax=Kosakonia arachidis TaxID=551989 RepID=A0A1I6XJL1_9ENTR|nr:hypothetical protein [Kosakonia arachidis]SFT38293.1 hypothetical protein SAMN05192562_10127 [Kosakonia arachidis]